MKKKIINILLKKVCAKVNLDINKRFPRHFQKYNLIGKRDLIGVEIGVDQAENAFHLLRKSDIKHLYLIDPYDATFPSESDSQDDKDKYINVARRKLKRYKNKTTWIKKKSEDAIDEIPDNLDFAYIDGNHEYKFVKEDIKLYYPKLKEGGILAGHDFAKNKDKPNCGVVEAVLEFVKENNLELYISFNDWWVIKPNKKQ